VGVVYNHLLMLDGKHISLQNQGRDVLTNPIEMGGNEKDILAKLATCKAYKNAFRKFAKYVPEQKELSLDHVTSAITFFYSDLSKYYAPFDDAMNNIGTLNASAVAGFNLFMGKAKCGTCHFVPYFNGVAPPFISSEFESIGVPTDTLYSRVSDDKGRYGVNPATETMHAFRTGSVRNAERTKPYMHNGVFKNLDEVIDFYDGGGGAGRKLDVPNQTLASDSLRLTATEKKDLLAFIHSLNENITFEPIPRQLPVSSKKELNNRKVGGVY
jgi:cytochrome c peroxidase